MAKSTIRDFSMLYEAVEKLSPAEKEVFHESFILEKKEAEIAVKLGVSTRTIGRYRKKILEILKNELQDNLPLLALLTILAI